MKKLCEMTLEELWHLFPISLVPHREEWKEYYKEMEECLKNILSDYTYNIYHIGSTAINGIWAKNIVDILIETDEDLKAIAESLTNIGVNDALYLQGDDSLTDRWCENNAPYLQGGWQSVRTDRGCRHTIDLSSEFCKNGNGFIIMSETKDRISLNYGYTEKGFAEKVYHIHLRHTGDRDEVYFRDYLNNNPQVAKEYEKLKFDLWKKYEFDRDAYTEAKTDFIKTYTKKGKEKYNFSPSV